MPALIDGVPVPTDRCRSCQAEVVWGRTDGGRAMPVDVEPSDVGNVLLSMVQGFARAKVCKTSELASVRQAGSILRTSHFVTCAHADKWRKRR